MKIYIPKLWLACAMLLSAANYGGAQNTTTQIPTKNTKSILLALQNLNPFKNKRTVCPADCGPYSCGAPNREERVLGGAKTASNEYPWIAYLTYRGKLYCGASLINDRYLVTAGHCLHRVPMAKVDIHLGKYHRTNSLRTMRVLKASKFHVHPQFNRRNFFNDIGVIELGTPIPITEYVRPICMPPPDGSYVGEYGTVVGWGRTTERGTPSEFPREISVPIMTNAECKKSKYQPREIVDNMFCAGYDQGKIDACQGDSGGPLMIMKRGFHGAIQYELTGIVSWGQGCGRAGYPGVYTDVGKQLKFVRDTIGADCFC